MDIVRVISAQKLTAEDIRKLEGFFKKKHNGGAEFKYETDASLLGGVLVIDGEQYYDATVKGQLASLKRSI